jgi:hypothetical protein
MYEGRLRTYRVRMANGATETGRGSVTGDFRYTFCQTVLEVLGW